MPKTRHKQHFPRANSARTHCLECGRPIERARGKWIHGRWPHAGRPLVKARNPGLFFGGLKRWEACDQARLEALAGMEEALRMMLDSGMPAGRIGNFIGRTEPGVRWMAEQLGITPRVVGYITPSKPRAIVEGRSRAKYGSILFGD